MVSCTFPPDAFCIGVGVTAVSAAAESMSLVASLRHCVLFGRLIIWRVSQYAIMQA